MQSYEFIVAEELPNTHFQLLFIAFNLKNDHITSIGVDKHNLLRTNRYKKDLQKKEIMILINRRKN